MNEYGLFFLAILFFSIVIGIIKEEIKKRRQPNKVEKEKIYCPRNGKTYLEKYPSQFYLDQYDEQKLEFVPFREAGPDPDGVFQYLQRREEYYFLKINGPMPFELKFFSKNGQINPEDIVKAKYILSQLVEMDKAANDESTLKEYQPELVEIEVTDENGDTYFDYVSGVVNTEWGIIFDVTENGWKCEGYG